MIDMKLRMLMMTCAFTVLGAWAQSAKSVLDKAASQLSRGAVSAHFTASGAMGKQNGTLVAQGNKFVLTHPKPVFGSTEKRNGRWHKVPEK